MRVDLTLTGASSVRSGFRGLSEELDRLNRKLDETQAKINGLGGVSATSSASSATAQVASQAVSGALGKFSSSTLINAASVVKKPTVVAKPPVASGGSAAGAGASARLGGPIGIAIAAITALSAASFEAANNIRDIADFRFNARGGRSANELAGISRGAGVDLGEAGGLAASRPGGSRQLIQEIEQFRKIQDDDLAARYARSRGIEGYRATRNLTDEQYETTKQVPQVSDAAIKTVDHAMADLNVAFGRLAYVAQTELAPVFAAVAWGAARLATVLAFSIESSPVYQFLKWLTEAMNGGENPASKIDSAASKMQDAASKIHDAAYGGGTRTRGAIPAAYGWYKDGQAVNSGIRDLGSL